MSTGEHVASLMPDTGYALIEVDRGEPPGTAGAVLAQFDDGDGVRIPPDGPMETYVVYDAEGNAYTRESWPEPASAPEQGDGPDDDGLRGKMADAVPDWMSGRGNF